MEKVPKTRIMKESIPCTFISKMAMMDSTMESIKKLEQEQSDFDKECWLIQQGRNNLEEYVLQAQSEFVQGGKYGDFMSTSEQDNFMGLVFQQDDFLMSDNFDASASEYQERLESLTSVGNIYVNRC